MTEVANFIAVRDATVVEDVDEAVDVLPLPPSTASDAEESINAFWVFGPFVLRALASRSPDQTRRFNICTCSLYEESPDLFWQARVLDEEAISSIAPANVL